MTSLTAEVKALEDKVTALQAKADTLDKVQALLAGPVQLTLAPARPQTPAEVFDTECREAAYALALAIGADPAAVNVMTTPQRLDAVREHVESLTFGSAWKCAGCGAAFARVRHDEGVTRCTKCVEVEQLAALLAQSQAEVKRLTEQVEALRLDAAAAAVAETEDAEAARTQDKLLHDVARALGVDQLEDASGNESGDPLDFTSDAITTTIVRHLADPLDEVLQRLQEAERIDLPEAAPGPVDAVKVINEAVAGLLEDLECANARTPNIATKDVEMLDRMLTEDPSPWDLSAANRAVLKRVREYVAGPIEKSTISPTLSSMVPKTTETRTDLTSPDIDANPDVDAAQRIAEEQAKPTGHEILAETLRVARDGAKRKKRSKKKAKEPPAPPPDAFTAQGYVITKMRDGSPRMYVMPSADPAHPHSIWTVAKAGARIFDSMTAALDERKRLGLKLGEPVPTEMVDEMPPPFGEAVPDAG